MDARDALIAEMLGDIGKLHDAVEQLKIDIPSVLQPLVELNARLEKSHADLIAATAEAQKVHEGHIAELVVQAKGDLEARTREMGEAMAKAFVLLSDSEARKITAKADVAASAALNSLASAIENEVKATMSQATGVNEIVAQNAKEFKVALDAIIARAKQSEAEYGRELQKRISANAPMGFWTQAMWMIGSVVFSWSLFAVLIYAGAFSSPPADPQSALSKSAKQ